MTQVTDIASQVVELIAPLSSEDKKRVMHAALLLTGEDVEQMDTKTVGNNHSDFPVKAQVWMKQNSITSEELGEIFHIDGDKATVITPTLSGKGGKEQTLNAYLLVGIGSLLTTGSSTIDDKAARAVCNDMGCFSEKHHAEYINEKGNLFIGNKKDGWTLTMPGQKAASLLIKELTKPVQ